MMVSSLRPFGTDALLLVARLLLAWIFLHEGWLLAARLDDALKAMAKLGVPNAAAMGAITIQLVAGIAIALGIAARPAAAALGLFCLATAILFHTNWAVRAETLHFQKDLAIAGGMIALCVTGPGRLALATLLHAWSTKRVSRGRSDDVP